MPEFAPVTRILFIVGEALSALTVVLMAMMARRMQLVSGCVIMVFE